VSSYTTCFVVVGGGGGGGVVVVVFVLCCWPFSYVFPGVSSENCAGITRHFLLQLRPDIGFDGDLLRLRLLLSLPSVVIASVFAVVVLGLVLFHLFVCFCLKPFQNSPTK